MTTPALSLASDNTAKDSGLYLGMLYGDAYPPRALRYKGPKHAISFGPQGVGKSMALCVPNLARLPRSIIVFDPKGQLASVTARRRLEMGRVLVLDPFELMPRIAPHLQAVWDQVTFHWNPLAQLKPRSSFFIKDAYAIAQAIVERQGNEGNGKFFSDSMENMLTALCMWEAMRPGDHKRTLRNIREELASGTLLDAFKQMSASDNYAVRIAGKATYKRMTDTTGKTTSLQDVIATGLKDTRFLDDDRLGADMYDGEAIDFGRLHEEITTIYVVLPADELEDQAKWLRMFLNVALRNLLRSVPLAPTLPPVLLCLDEFGNLGRVPEVLRALNIARDFRIQMWFFLQNLAQLKASYEKEYSYFFSGSGALTTYAPGFGDWETAEYISKVVGKTESEITSYSDGVNFNPSQVGPGSHEGTSRGMQVHNLIEPEDMFRLPRGQTINFVEPFPLPVKGETPIYPRVKGCDDLDRNPYFHG